MYFARTMCVSKIIHTTLDVLTFDSTISQGVRLFFDAISLERLLRLINFVDKYIKQNRKLSKFLHWQSQEVQVDPKKPQGLFSSSEFS